MTISMLDRHVSKLVRKIFYDYSNTHDLDLH